MSHYGYDWYNVDVMKDKVLSRVYQKDDDELHFHTEDGEHYVLYHSQDCCEHVYIESIVGDLSDLVGTQLLVSEEVDSEGMNIPEDPDGYTPESFTWTFYKFATIKGYVDVRFYGSSNGYYSESVSFVKISD